MKISWAFLEGNFVKFLNRKSGPRPLFLNLHRDDDSVVFILAYSYYKFPDSKSMATVGTSKQNSRFLFSLDKTSSP